MKRPAERAIVRPGAAVGVRSAPVVDLGALVIHRLAADADTCRRIDPGAESRAALRARGAGQTILLAALERGAGSDVAAFELFTLEKASETAPIGTPQ